MFVNLTPALRITKATKVNQPCNKPLDKMFNSIYIDIKGILSKKRGSVLGLSADE